MASVDKRPNGKWRARYREFPGGPQRARHFDLKKEAEAFLVDVRHDLARGRYVPPEVAGTSYRVYVETFLSCQLWRPSTREIVTRAVGRGTAVWGDRPLASIRQADVQALVSASHLAPSSLAMEFTHLSSLFRMALVDGLIVRNPCAGVKLPKITNGKVEPLSIDQVRRLHEAAPDWFRIAVVIGAGLGLRQSELRGLTIDRVRFLRRDVRIDRQGARHVEDWGDVKSVNSKRTIPTDTPILDAISLHVATFGMSESGLVLHRDGRFVTASAFDRAWRATRTAAGMGAEVRFHDLRHHLASELLGDGVSVVAVAEILGDTPATVLNTYAHLVRSDNDRVRATVTRLWNAEDWLRTAEGASVL